MSATVLVAGLAAPLAIVAALAPSGAWTRRALRRTDPPVLPRRRARLRMGRRAVDGVAPSATGAAATPVASVLAGAGRRLRALAGRSPDPGADLAAGVACVGAGVAAVLVSPLVAVPVAVGAWAVPAARRRAARRSHERAVRAALPDVVDLFRLAVGAGLSLRQAVVAVAERSPAPVDAALAEVVRRVQLGERLGDALSALDRLGDPALPLASSLRGAARYGAPLGDALERVAVDARVLRRRRAEEDARRLPVQLLFPLVLCVLPAFGLLAVVPLLLASLRSLQL